MTYLRCLGGNLLVDFPAVSIAILQEMIVPQHWQRLRIGFSGKILQYFMIHSNEKLLEE